MLHDFIVANFSRGQLWKLNANQMTTIQSRFWVEINSEVKSRPFRVLMNPPSTSIFLGVTSRTLLESMRNNLSLIFSVLNTVSELS